MANIVQFRCPKCQKLLVKYDKKKDEMLYQVEGLESRKEGDFMLIKCPKCETISYFTPGGLVEFLMKKTVIETDKKIESAEIIDTVGVRV